MGEVVHQVKRPVRVVQGESYNLLGVRWYGGGPFLREVGVGGTIKATQLYTVRRGDFIYNRLFAWKGSFGIVGNGLHGSFVSGEFPVFTTEAAQLSVDYLNLLMCRPTVWSVIEKQSTGSTTTSRNRWKEERFLDWGIILPPLDEQRRIIDLIAAVDAAIEGAEREREAADCAYGVILTDAVGGERPTDRLADLVEWARAGGTPSRKQSDYFGGPIPWLKSGEVTNRSLLMTEESITERALTESAAWVVPTGSVLLAMYGATAGKVGFTTFPLATNQAVLAMVGKDGTLDNRWFYHLLRSRSEHLKRQATGAAQPNLSKDRVLSEELPRVRFAEQQDLSALLDEFLWIVDSAREFVDKVRQVRSALLGDLLSGDHEIPDSYDQFLSA